MIEVFYKSENVKTFLGNLSSVFTVIGVVVGIITLILAIKNLKAFLLQLNEMELQRTHSQEPDVFVEPKKFKVDYREEIEYIVFDSPWVDSQQNVFNRNRQIPIEISNIGNGVAKYINVEIFFEEEFLKKVMELDQQKKLFNIRITQSEGYRFFHYEFGEIFKKGSSHNYVFNERKQFAFNYLRPEQNASIFLDANQRKILNIALFLLCKSDESDLIPKIKINISYYDSFNNRYEKEIDLYVGNRKSSYYFTSDRSYEVNFDLNSLNRLPEKHKSK